jgi:Bacterial Ig domain
MRETAVVRVLRGGATLVFAASLALGPVGAARALAETGAANDVYEVNEDDTLVVNAPGVLGNDTHDDGTPCVTGVDVQGLMGDLGDQANTGWREDGWFTFTPYEEWIGETSFIYGMTKVDEVNTCTGASADQATVTINVLPVNDAPTAVLVLTCLDTVRVAQDSGPYDDPDHCTEMHNWGPIDENTQLVEEWVVTTDRPELFSERPSVRVFDQAYGTLHFTPERGAHGLANVTVRGRDTGGTARGGQDLSSKLTFSIRIVPKATEPPATQPTATESPATAEPTVLPSASAPAETAGAASPSAEPPTAEPTPGEVPSDPTGVASGAPMLIAVVLVVGIIAVGAGIMAPRLIRRPGKPR